MPANVGVSYNLVQILKQEGRKYLVKSKKREVDITLAGEQLMDMEPDLAHCRYNVGQTWEWRWCDMCLKQSMCCNIPKIKSKVGRVVLFSLFLRLLRQSLLALSQGGC